MCGIAGVFQKSGAVNRADLERAAALLQHRGPDHSDVFINGRIGLAHTRLSIIDIEGGDQPFHHPSGMHLVANGEVYNYVELQALHKQKSLRYSSHSDCECILHCYADKGLEGITQLNGMFAFALFDSSKNSLLLARDRLGIKPLFYAKTHQGLIFASEIKALLCLLDSVPSISDDALAQFLQNQFYTGADSIFEGIYQVLPGQVLEIDQHLNIQAHQYWSATDVASQQIDLQQATESFTDLFGQVMTEHMRADVPYGLFLSGGIDSSLLLAELTERKGEPIRTFSVGYAGVNMQDELSQAEELAKHFASEHTSLKVERDDLFNRIVYSIWAADDLMRDYACLPTSLLSELATKELKVVFSGEGGDESFAGYRRYRPSIEQSLKGMLLGAGGLRSSGQLASNTPKKLFSASLRNVDVRRTVKSAWNDTPSNWSNMQKAQYVDLTTALADNLLVKADRMMMSFGLEGRVPLCDHRIVEFGLSLPDKLKYPAKQGKWFLRQWSQSKLPADHLKRPKRGFYVPVNEWFQGDFLLQLGQKLQTNQALKSYFNPSAVAYFVQQQQTGKNYSRELFCLMQFAIWHKLFVEGSPAPSPIENPLDWL